MWPIARLSLLHYIATALITLAHLAGLVVALLLLSRKKGTAAVLATVAFALLVLLDVGRIVETTLSHRLLPQIARAARVGPWIAGGADCCCSLLDLGAIGCLIAALWKGLGGPETTPQEAAPEETVSEEGSPD